MHQHYVLYVIRVFCLLGYLPSDNETVFSKTPSFLQLLSISQIPSSYWSIFQLLGPNLEGSLCRVLQFIPRDDSYFFTRVQSWSIRHSISNWSSYSYFLPNLHRKRELLSKNVLIARAEIEHLRMGRLFASDLNRLPQKTLRSSFTEHGMFHFPSLLPFLDRSRNPR